jgi:hypothetical protein
MRNIYLNTYLVSRSERKHVMMYVILAWSWSIKKLYIFLFLPQFLMVKVKSDLSKDLTKNIVHKAKFCNILIVVVVSCDLRSWLLTTCVDYLMSCLQPIKKD